MSGLPTGQASGPGSIPKTMKAIRFNAIRDWELTEVPVPELRPGDVLVKLKSAGICGTDLHILDGDFISGMPVVPGHESSGIVVKLGENVQGFSLGEKVTADNSELCGSCHYCRKGQLLYCEDFKAHGINLPGGFAEYCAFPAEKLFKFHNLSWEEAACFEAASCAIHGLDRIRPEVGSNILLIGAGATGLLLAQLLKNNGGAHLVLASNAGPKMQLARKLNAADEYVDLDRKNPERQWDELKTKYPYGFDVVVEASGVHQLLERGLDLTTRGGKLIFYGVYENAARISIPPSKIFGDEITCTGSFSMMYCMPRAVAYLDSRKIDVTGIVTHKFPLEKFGEALDSIRDKSAVKAAIIFED